MESKLFGWFEEMLGGVALLSCSVYLFIWSGAQLGRLCVRASKYLSVAERLCDQNHSPHSARVNPTLKVGG